MNRLAKFLSPFKLNSISGKLLLTVGTLLVPTLLLGYLLYSSVNTQIVFARNERIGTEYFGSIRQAIGHSVEYRRLTAEFVSGQTEGKTFIERKQGELDAAIARDQDAFAIVTERRNSQRLLGTGKEWVLAVWRTGIRIKLARLDTNAIAQTHSPRSSNCSHHFSITLSSFMSR